MAATITHPPKCLETYPLEQMPHPASDKTIPPLFGPFKSIKKKVRKKNRTHDTWPITGRY